MRSAALLLILAGCQQADTPGNQSAAQPVELPRGNVSVAEGIVRQRLGNPQDISFAEAERSASQGVPIICGAFEQNGERQRYIVVGGSEAFIEPQMEAGEMDRAFTEFCRESGRA